jgi:hypothetical protein
VANNADKFTLFYLQINILKYNIFPIFGWETFADLLETEEALWSREWSSRLGSRFGIERCHGYG